MPNVYTSQFLTKIALNGLKSSLLDNPTYVYVADGLSNITTPEDIEPTVDNYLEQVRSIIFGKKIQPSDLYSMIKRVGWQTGTVYSRYDDKDPSLAELNFFVFASNRAVYKCLNNKNGAPSTIEPSSLYPEPAELADGYVWKYMFRITTDQLNNIATNFLIPVVTDANTVTAAVGGAINVVDVITPGSEYLTTSGTFESIISTSVMEINSGALAIDQVYTDFAVYVSAGPGAGQIAVIGEYYSNATGRYIETISPITGLTINSQYVIAPAVKFDGDGADAVARSVVVQGQISKVEVLSPGGGYTYAVPSIVAANGYGSGSALQAIMSPLTGHGSDAESELFARNLTISIKFNGSESAKIADNVTFSKYGLVRNVTEYSNNQVVFTSNTFSNLVGINTIQINGLYSRGDHLTTIEANTQLDRTQVNVLYANSTFALGQYINKNPLDEADSLINQNGVTASVVGLTPPEVSMYKSQVLSFGEINTVTRSANTAETVNIVLKV